MGEMDQDGVDAELRFTAVSGQRMLGRGRDTCGGFIALARGYNDWLAQEYAAVDPDRLLGLAILPAATVDDSIAKLEKVAALPEIHGIVLHRWPNGGAIPKPEEDDRLWSRALELDVPLTARIIDSMQADRQASVAGCSPQTPDGPIHRGPRKNHRRARVEAGPWRAPASCRQALVLPTPQMLGQPRNARLLDMIESDRHGRPPVWEGLMEKSLSSRGRPEGRAGRTVSASPRGGVRCDCHRHLWPSRDVEDCAP